MSKRQTLILATVTVTWSITGLCISVLLPGSVVWRGILAAAWITASAAFFVLLRHVLSTLNVFRRDVRAVANQVNTVAGSVGRAGPVLRRVDDRGRSILEKVPWLLQSVGPRSSSFSCVRMDVAVLVRSTKDIERAVALWQNVAPLFEQLLLVLSSDASCLWGQRVEENMGEKVTVVAAEHIADGSVDLGLLCSGDVVYCVTDVEHLPRIDVVPQVVDVSQILVGLGVDSGDESEGVY